MAHLDGLSALPAVSKRPFPVLYGLSLAAFASLMLWGGLYYMGKGFLHFLT